MKRILMVFINIEDRYLMCDKEVDIWSYRDA